MKFNDDPSAGANLNLPPVGDRVVLTNGAVLETPNADVITQLQAIDSRVHYFPTPDIEQAQSVSRGMAFYRGVVDHLGKQVVQDFPGTRLAVRGTTAALTERFPFWEDGDGNGDMNTVLDILQSGSDSGADRVRVGEIDPDGTLNAETQEFLGSHFTGLMLELDGIQRDQVFPALLVYRTDAFTAGDFRHGFNKLKDPPADRLAAIYITDKIV
jgi:hypothetical protein